MRAHSFLIFALSVLFIGCQPKPNSGDLVRNLVVNTKIFGNVTALSSYLTYELQLDTISYFNGSSDYYPKDTLQCTTCAPACFPVSCTINYNDYLLDVPTTITTRIRTNLDAAGYSKVYSKQNPDFKVYVVIIENYSVTQSYAYNPYGGYGYGYYGYGGYGSYYPTYNVSDQADLYLEIFDLHKFANGKPTLIWSADISDLVSSPDYNSKTTSIPLTIAAIDQAFKQSPYIKKN